jgi:hypothetical protein
LPQGREDGSGFKVEILIEKLLALGPFGSWHDFLGWVTVLLRETSRPLQVPALIDRQFLFQIPNFCSVKLIGLGLCFVKFTRENLPAPDTVGV